VLKQASEETERQAFRESGEDYDAHELIQEIEKEMIEAADALEFERAAILRDQLFELRTAQKSGNAPVETRGAVRKENRYPVAAAQRRSRKSKM